MLHTHSTTTARPFDPAAFDQRKQPQPARRCVPFGIGKTITTPGAQAALDASHETHDLYLKRHADGTWTETPAEEIAENRAAIKEGRGVFSQHRLKTGARLWLATLPDRSRTIVFTPDEV